MQRRRILTATRCYCSPTARSCCSVIAPQRCHPRARGGQPLVIVVQAVAVAGRALRRPFSIYLSSPLGDAAQERPARLAVVLGQAVAAAVAAEAAEHAHERPRRVGHRRRRLLRRSPRVVRRLRDAQWALDGSITPLEAAAGPAPSDNCRVLYLSQAHDAGTRQSPLGSRR